MFDRLFKCPNAIRRYRTAPLLSERLRFLEHLRAARIADSTLRITSQYLLVVMDQLRLAHRRGQLVNATEIQWAGVRWSESNQTRNRRSRPLFIGHATRWLQFLGRWVPPAATHAFAEQIEAYAQYMRVERGLSPSTVFSRCWVVEDFLPRLGLTLSQLSISRIDDVLAAKITDGRYARVSVQTYAGSLRDFFRFAEMQGWCRTGLAAAIRAPRVFPHESLPSAPSWEHVTTLITGCRGDQPVELRNRATLMLLAVYGLRAGEVIRLTLDDFDWNRERVTVKRSKNQQMQTYPLCRSVGNAILRYLRGARPRTDYRELFLTLRPPFRPLTRVALTAIVTRKVKTLGIPLAHYGPHALRHSCAIHLLQKGFSFKEIGDHLGHRHPDATAIYAKVDMTGLREVADFDLEGVV
jgi:site-specific recombinase XerD